MAAVSQIKISNNIYDVHSIEYIEGTQAAPTYTWTGTSQSYTLPEVGRAIAYKLPYVFTDGSIPQQVQLKLSLPNYSGGVLVTKAIMMNGSPLMSDVFGANSIIFMIYDGTAWQVISSAGGNSVEVELDTTTDSFVKTISATTSNFVNSVSATTNTLSVASVDGKKLVLSAPTVVIGVSAVSTSAVTGVTSTTAMAVTGVATTDTIPSAVGVYF